ncbi:barstar family protein [Actinoplanes sp. CA-054009]
MSELVIDLRGRALATLDDFWDAVAGPAGLPDWFGRNLDAWIDTIQHGGISEVLDSHDRLVVHVDRAGYFARDDREVRQFKRSFAGRRSQLVVHPVSPGGTA